MPRLPAAPMLVQCMTALAHCVDFGMSALTPLLGSKPTVLLLSAEHGQAGADPMLARIAVTRALNAGRDVASDDASTTAPPRRKPVKPYRVVR
jgi:hypothetical protein